MALFLKENQELQDNMYDIPKELENHLKDTLNKYQDYGTTASGAMSKGFKRLQGLVDPNYNKQDDNTSEDGSRQISFSDMKRIKHDFDHMSKDPHDIQRVLNGGEKMASFVNDTLRKERTKVEPVLKQKEVETRNKNAVKPTVAPMKPIEVGNITANVHENKKTIFISEYQLNVLKEYRDQLELPFEDPHTSNPYMRPNYQHYIDFLESIGRYGQLPKSNCDIQKYVDTYFEDAVYYWWGEENDRYNPNELYDYYLKEFFEQHQDNFYKLFNISPHMVDEYLDDKDCTYDLINHYLSEFGQKEWENYLVYRFEDNLSAYHFPNNLTINDRGLIYVERTIVLPNMNDYKFHTTLYNNRNDLYKHLTNNYEGVGIYWTWAKGAGEPYNGSEFNVNVKVQQATLKGWVKCEDINWEETLMMNTYCLSHEREIRLPHHTEVEVFEVVLSNGKKLPLKQPIIVLT